MRQIVIERSKWLRGAGHANSALLSLETGKMCCLGFYALACGFTPDAIAGKTSPEKLIVGDGIVPAEMQWLLQTERGILSNYPLNSNDCGKLMDLNDNEQIDIARRESAIAAIFRAHDVEVTFVD